MTVEHHEFASDNTAPICADAWAALQEANTDYAAAYGEDRGTARVCDRIREIFETDCDVYFVFTGTAANALALAQVCQSFRSIICHQNAHIQTDECGAPEFFTGGSKLLLVGGKNGKIDIQQVEAVIARQPELHAHKPRVISITQATELGTIYTRREISALAEFARRREMFVHMDGARFANAIAAIGCSAKEITWQSGVDVLCFGGTKNGAVAAELVVFFKKELSREFEYRVKQAAQLGSKSRFLAAQWHALLHNEVWLKNARHANSMAREFTLQIREAAKIDTVLPVEANAVFVRLAPPLDGKLRSRAWHVYQFMEPDIYRLMCSWATRQGGIDAFASDLLR